MIFIMKVDIIIKVCFVLVSSEGVPVEHSTSVVIIVPVHSRGRKKNGFAWLVKALIRVLRKIPGTLSWMIGV